MSNAYIVKIIDVCYMLVFIFEMFYNFYIFLLYQNLYDVKLRCIECILKYPCSGSGRV